MSAAEQPRTENDLIAWLKQRAGHAPELAVGIGDDCAVVEVGGARLLLKVDLCLEGVHFLRAAASDEAPNQARPRQFSPHQTTLGQATPRQAGYKAVARAVSDIAAMGGTPRELLIGVGIPAAAPAELAVELFEGVLAAAAASGCIVAGGDTKSWPDERMTISVSVIGRMDEDVAPVLRSGGRPGDRLVVTGALGGSLLGRHLHPEPRLAEGRWLATHGARALIDLSDGLARDLRLLCEASGCGALLRAATIPIAEDAGRLARTTGRTPLEHALTDGEDYELLAAVPPELDLSDPPFKTRLTVIGTLEADPDHEARIETDAGTRHPLPAGGYLHRFGGT